MKTVTENELIVCNIAGVILSIVAGLIAGGKWILFGLLGTYFVPILVIFTLILAVILWANTFLLLKGLTKVMGIDVIKNSNKIF